MKRQEKRIQATEKGKYGRVKTLTFYNAREEKNCCEKKVFAFCLPYLPISDLILFLLAPLMLHQCPAAIATSAIRLTRLTHLSSSLYFLRKNSATPADPNNKLHFFRKNTNSPRRSKFSYMSNIGLILLGTTGCGPCG
jgi:hypothetical protein